MSREGRSNLARAGPTTCRRCDLAAPSPRCSAPFAARVRADGRGGHRPAVGVGLGRSRPGVCRIERRRQDVELQQGQRPGCRPGRSRAAGRKNSFILRRVSVWSRTTSRPAGRNRQTQPSQERDLIRRQEFHCRRWRW